MNIDSRFLTFDEVLQLHQNQLILFGGKDGIRSLELLESAMAQPMATAFGKFVHKTIFEQASAYLFHICQNHPFIDGNKRTALQACDVFLLLNGYDLIADQNEVAEMVLAVARGEIKKPGITDFLRKHSKSLP